MEAQSMLDVLTDHLAIYHRSSSGTQPESSRARQAVVEWLVGLNCEQRRAALTFVDTSWVAILLLMQKHLRTEGLCTFFLLPDVPVAGRSNTTAFAGTTKTTRKSNGKGIPKGDRKGTEHSSSLSAINKDFTSFALPLPGLCFRRARGLVKRSETETQENSGNMLVHSIRLFSAGDGENNTTSLYEFDNSCRVNCVTVTEDLIANVTTFLEVMDDLSHGEFLNTPILSAASAWAETPWLKGMGYYSMPAFIANRFEIEMWSAWYRTQGTKKPPRSLGVKSRNTQQNGNAAVAASVFGRKQGWMGWWRKLQTKERAELANFALAMIAKSEVLKIVGKARTERGKVNDSKTRGRLKTSSKDSSYKQLNDACRTNLSDSEIEQPVGLEGEDVQGAEVAPYLAGLRALRQLSESGLLCERYQVTDVALEDETSWLFGSTLECFHTFSDHVRRKARDSLVKVRNDQIELELLGDGSSGKAPGGNRVESSDGKSSKTKKKRRKSTASSKTEAPKEEDKTCISKPVPPQEEMALANQIPTDLRHLESDLGYVQVQVQAQSFVGDQLSSEANQLSSEANSSSGGKQHVSRKGKGGKSKGKKDDKLHQPTLPLQKSAMNGEELARHILDTKKCSDGSSETGNGPCSDYAASSTSGDSPAYSSPSFSVEGEGPARSVTHCSSAKCSSSCPISNLGQRITGKSQNTPIRSLHSTSDDRPENSRENDEVAPDKLVSTMGSISCPSASDSDIYQISSSLCPTPALFPEPLINSEAFAVPTGGRSDSRHKMEDRSSDQTLRDTSFPIVEMGCRSVERQYSLPVAQKKLNLESSIIRFGTVDTVLPELNIPISVPVQANSSVKPVAPLVYGNEEKSLETTPNNAKPVPSSRNGRVRFPTTPRQLDYSNGRHSHYQLSPSFRSSPHEWPGSPQFGYFGAYHQPKATDWLQLDVGRGWPHRMDPSLLSYRNTPVLRQQSGLAESLIPRSVASRNGNVGNIDRPPPLLQPSYNISPPVGYTIGSKEEPRLNGRHFISPSPFTSGYGEVEAHGQGRSIDDSEGEERIAYDTDVDDYGTYKSGEFDDLDGYMISEEEGERYVEDAEDGSSNYHEIFGGGVMYWNASDYAGLGYSRPGSLSSEDSSWARHEAELSAVLDDIVNYQPLAGSNVPSCTPSPPSSSSVPISFERLSPVASSNPLHFLPRPTGKEFSEKFGQLSNQGLSLDDQFVGARVPITLEVIEQIRGDTSAQPILRPIVVVRERQLSSGEARRLQEANSPHTVPRSRRDLPGLRKRPPSPVLRCVPPAPPPPPPSPVSGPRRRKGLMGARSGSSSPRHWGLVNWPYKDESEGSEGKFKGEGPEGFPIWGHKRGSTTSTPLLHPLSGALLRERLVAIPPLSLEQEHPDVSMPMKTTLLHNSNPALHLPLTKLLSGLHVEIEAFSLQVEGENKMRKPFINMAVKKVAHSLQVLWPRSRINIFGSIATGLALPTSDVDLVVCLPPVRNLEPIKEAGILEGRNGIKETSLQQAARYLADQDWVKNDTMKTIENTPVPIIMMVAEFLPHQCEFGDEDVTQSYYPNIRKEAFEEVAKAEDGVAVPLPESVSCLEDSNLETEDKKGPWGGKAARQLVHLDISFETPSHTGLRTAELVRELVGLYPALSPLALVLKQFLTDRSLDQPYTGGLSSYCLVLLITRFLQHQHHHGKPSSLQNLGMLFMDFLHFFGCDFDPLKMGIRIRGGGTYLSRDRYNDIDPLYIEDPLHPDNNVGRNCFRILQCVKAFADGYAVLERKLHDISTGSEDVENGAECLQLLQMLLPCIMTR